MEDYKPANLPVQNKCKFSRLFKDDPSLVRQISFITT